MDETEKLGKYRLLSLIATGGMGEVFLARHEGPAGFSKTVVIKRILRHLADDQGFIDMFLNEARLAAQLQHPNIAQIFGLEHERDTWFIAMEHVHGRSCRACLNEARKADVRFPPRIAARICAQALQGLQFAHRLTDEQGRPLGILHRDVSPDNVLVSFSGAVKLVDFGIAKAMTRSFTFTGRLKGKFPYMAPEQFIAGAAIDARIDLFAMGVVLHELVTLEAPANSPRSPAEAAQKRTPWIARPDLPPALNQILDKALQADPARRWESADAFAHALEEFIADTGEPLTPAHVAGFLEELFGRDVVRTNPSVATMAPSIRAGHTDVLPALPSVLAPNHKAAEMWASSPTVIEPALQYQRRGGSSSGVDLVAVPLPRPAYPTDPEPLFSTGSEQDPPPRRWQRFAGAAAALLLVVIGLVAWLWPAPEPVEVPPLKLGPPVAVARPEPIVPPPPVPAPVVSAPVVPAPVVPAPVVPPPVVPPPVVPAPDPASEPVAAVASDPPRPPKQKPKRRPPPARTGKVAVRVNPWAEVFFNGRSYGITPLKSAVEVPAGQATFTLKNPQLGVHRKVTVKVPAGTEVVLKADLFKK